MRKKKGFILATSLLALTVAFPVFATQTLTTATSQTTKVKYSVGETYTVSIPADFSLTSDGSGNFTAERKVAATGVLIENGKTLNVEMSSANYVSGGEYTLNYGTDEVSKIPYSIQKGDADFTNADKVLSITSGTEEDSQALTFSTTDAEIAEATKSGEHTDTLTFTVSVD